MITDTGERPDVFESESEAWEDIAAQCDCCGRYFLPSENGIYWTCSTCHLRALADAGDE